MIRHAAAALLGFAALGCATEHEIAAQLVAAAQPSRLPEVVACWEKAFEEADFEGEYVATVDFVVEGGTSRLRDVEVTAMEPSGAEALSACLAEALGRSALPVEADRDGPGFSTSRDLRVRGYRIAFVGASRKRASARQANVLLGPRSDRCQGLYAHDPPRDASILSAEVAQGESRAAGFADRDRNLYARELQKTYDVALELRERLHLDAAEPGLPRANRKRILQALEQAEASARKAGAAIGCEPPPLR